MVRRSYNNYQLYMSKNLFFLCAIMAALLVGLNANIGENVGNDICVPAYNVNANRCTLNATSMQFECAMGFVSFQNKYCFACPAKCLQCSGENFCSSYDDASCMVGMKVNTAGTTCIACSVTNCQRCSAAGKCDKCADGYLINRTTGMCAIPTGVKSCGAANYCGVCTTVPTGTAYQTACRSCKDPRKKPRKNKDGTYPTCYECNLTNCYYCTANNNCSQCASGYSLKDYTDKYTKSDGTVGTRISKRCQPTVVAP